MKKYVETPLYLLYTKQSICCMCVRVEHFYKIYEEYSFKIKTLLSCQIWWQEENLASLWFALPLLFQLAGLGLAHGNINPILIYGVCTSDMENIPCYTVVMTQLFSQFLLKDLTWKLKLHVLLAGTPKSILYNKIYTLLYRDPSTLLPWLSDPESNINIIFYVIITRR